MIDKNRVLIINLKTSNSTSSKKVELHSNQLSDKEANNDVPQKVVQNLQDEIKNFEK